MTALIVLQATSAVPLISLTTQDIHAQLAPSAQKGPLTQFPVLVAPIETPQGLLQHRIVLPVLQATTVQ